MNFVYISIFVLCGIFKFGVQAYKPLSAPQHHDANQQHYQHLIFFSHNRHENNDKQPSPFGVNAVKQDQTQLFEIVNEWKYLDFEYSTYQQRKRAIENR